MPPKSKNLKDFQNNLLKFLFENSSTDVHIYHYVMNAWSNDMSQLTLPDMKNAITDLCEKKMISSQNDAHNNIGVPGISEEEQMNNAICQLLPAGKNYYKKIKLARIIRNVLKMLIILIIIIIALYTLYYYRKVFFRFMFKNK